MHLPVFSRHENALQSFYSLEKEQRLCLESSWSSIFSCVWERYDLVCNGFNKKIERLQYSIFFVDTIALQGDISFGKRFVKNGFRVTSVGYFIN